MHTSYRPINGRECRVQPRYANAPRLPLFTLTLVVAILLSSWPGLASAQSGNGSLISVEAESTSARKSAGGQSWKTVSVSGATGGRAVQALPNNNTNREDKFVSRSPRLDYRVDFAQSGTYYVWIRGRAKSNKDDSLHVGLNGAAQSRADDVTGFGSQWTWSDRTMDGSRTVLRVSSAGRKTINLWMREDGMVVDRIVLTKDASLRPNKFGSAGKQPGTPTAPAPTPPTGSGSGSDNVISIEMEQYQSNVGVGGHDWVPALVSGASGGGSMQPLPNNNTKRDSGFVVNSPRLDYDVNFPASGRYYVWVRGRGATDNDDSLHVGLNGQAKSRADNITGFNSGWTWSDETMDGVRASIDVATAGRQQLTVWMREDGTIVDKVFLTTNASLRPTDFGPLGPPSTDAAPPPAAPPSSQPPPSTPPPSAPSRQVLALEAEQYLSNVGVGGHNWTPVAVSGSSGGTSLQALPNTGQNNNTGYLTRSPRLDYAVNFPAAGTYYVWVRGRGETGPDDSLHVGLNGQPTVTADRITGFDSSWRWSNDTMDNQRATIVVSNAGKQVLNIWMREDGTVIDKIMLTTDGSAEPADFGSLGPAVTEPLPPGGSASPPSAPANSPPEISGSPATSVVEGSTYQFVPTVRDADGDRLTLTVSGLPNWASFRASDGRIRGTPGPGDVGRYRNIVITVSDGEDTASLGPFTIDVNATANGSVTLTWTPPTRNTDGSPLTDLAGYELRWGPDGGNLNQSVTLSNGGLSRYVLDGISPGRYRFVIYAVNRQGVSSSPSNTARVTVQ